MHTTVIRNKHFTLKETQKPEDGELRAILNWKGAEVCFTPEQEFQLKKVKWAAEISLVLSVLKWIRELF